MAASVDSTSAEYALNHGLFIDISNYLCIFFPPTFISPSGLDHNFDVKQKLFSLSSSHRCLNIFVLVLWLVKWLDSVDVACSWKGFMITSFSWSQEILTY